ncbi:hypothetical protein [Streptomyces sp. NPDC047974]|uniref:hypothetical protein n=1 Tax=Streptomyces sp. NPDC047974 TaxID=3154343 RepID=UPI0033CF22C5
MTRRARRTPNAVRRVPGAGPETRPHAITCRCLRCRIEDAGRMYDNPRRRT